MRPAVLIATAAILGAAALLGFPLAPALAGPPAETPPSEAHAAAPVDPGADPAPTDPTAGIAGFWLSLELIGPRGAQIDAARGLVRPPIVDALPRGGAPPPGELVGRVDTLQQALRWVEQNAFSPASGARAPLPGGVLLDEHGVYLTALVVTGAGPSGGTASFPWPPASALASERPMPPDGTPDRPSGGWRPASLGVARAPLFAAPSPTLPPASERYRVVESGDSIWQLDVLERCTEAGACLRWAQVLVREGDRFFGGWLPATQVVPDDEWVAGPNERRFALLPSHRTRAEIGYVLLEHGPEGREPPRGLAHAHAGRTWPGASAQVLGEQLVVLIDGEPELSLDLLPTPAPTL